MPGIRHDWGINGWAGAAHVQIHTRRDPRTGRIPGIGGRHRHLQADRARWRGRGVRRMSAGRDHARGDIRSGTRPRPHAHRGRRCENGNHVGRDGGTDGEDPVSSSTNTRWACSTSRRPARGSSATCSRIGDEKAGSGHSSDGSSSSPVLIWLLPPKAARTAPVRKQPRTATAPMTANLNLLV